VDKDQDGDVNIAMMQPGTTAAQQAGLSMVQSRAWKKIAVFLSLVVAFSAAITMLQAFLPSGSRLLFIAWSPFVADVSKMWSVGIAALIALFVVDGSARDVGWRLCPPRYFVIAAAVPLVCDLAIYGLVWGAGIAGFRGYEFFLTRLALSPFGVLAHLVYVAGEEIGWRGVLVPNLARASGFATSAVLPGAVWAVWHYPDILYFNYNVGTPPAFALACFTVSLIGLGVFLTWLRLASRSVWPPILFHGVANTLSWGVFERTTQYGASRPYFTSEFGVGLAMASIVVAYVFWMRRADADQAVAELSLASPIPA
jgi:uncharacterized protein